MDVAVVYCRKSAESALPTDVSFDIQEAECAKYAAQQGYGVLRVLKESHSGADLAGRPLIWEAIDDIQKGRANVLLVRNYDRLARKPEHQGVILFEVEEKGHGRVEAALEPYDPNDVMQKTMRGVMAVVAEAERLNAVARMERGKRYRAERGELSGSSNPLFGYAWADDVAGERTRYVVDTDTGPIVIRIFRLAVTGHSLRAIAKLLNAEHVVTPSQWAASQGHIGRRRVGEVWMTEMVRRVIQDRTYMGDGQAYRYKRVRTKNGKHSHIRVSGGVKLSVPTLVDEVTWNAANAAVAAKEETGRPPTDHEATWLRGHVYCGVCESRMIARRATGYGSYLYHCGQRASQRTDGTGCTDFSIRAHLLDPVAYEALTAWLGAYRLGTLREKMIERLGLGKLQTLVAISEGYQVQLVEKRDELDTARRRARQTKDDVLAAQFMHDAEELNKEIAKLEADYAQAREAMDHFEAGNAWVDATLERIRHGIKDIEAPTEEEIRALRYDERRALLAPLGLYFKVYPVGYPKRVEVAQHFLLDPVTNEPVDAWGQSTQPRSRSFRLVITLDELSAHGKLNLLPSALHHVTK